MDDSYPEWYAARAQTWKQIRDARPSRAEKARLSAKCKKKKCVGCGDCTPLLAPTFSGDGGSDSVLVRVMRQVSQQS